MIRESKARNDIVEIGRRLWMRGFVAANDGNLSVRLGNERVLITPTGVSKGFMNPADLLVCDMQGVVLSHHNRVVKPTTELPMHLEIYHLREDVGGIVHAHPPMSTAFAAAGLSLKECLLAETAILLGEVPLAPYATPSTQEVPASIRPVVPTCDAVLLANHGAVTYGESIQDAHFKMETLEHSAKVTFYAKQLGSPMPLPVKELKRIQGMREKVYGLENRVSASFDDKNMEGDHSIDVLKDLIVESVLSRLSES